MTEFVIKLLLFLTGFGMGFLVACMGASRIVAEKHDLKVKCARLEAEKEALKKALKKTLKKTQEIQKHNLKKKVSLQGL